MSNEEKAPGTHRKAPKANEGAILTRESDLSSERFSDRLQSAKENETVPHLAIRTGISRTVLYGYIKGENEPTRPALIRMARALGVNLAWLATGEGPMKTGQEERATYAAAARDLERLEEVIRKVEQYLEDKGVTRPPAIKAQIIVGLYSRVRTKELIEQNDLIGLLDLF